MDLSEVEQLNAASYNFEVVQLLDNNDMQSIEPGESIHLRWVFNPLEPKTYSWTVPFRVHGYDSYEYEVDVLFTAEGFMEDPHVTPITTILPLPKYQVMPIPNQSVFLSEERLSLGDIPIGASVTRIIFLTNYNQDDFMDFAFVLSSSLAKDIVEVFPSEGDIAPESHVAVRVTIRCMVASVFDFDVPVLIRTKPPPMEENEDLADDGDAPEQGSSTPVSGRPATGAAPSSARGSTAGDGKSKKKKRKVSIIEQPPPLHKTLKPAKMGGKGSVSFMEGSRAGAGGERNKSLSMDDTASVKSGSSKMSAMTGLTGASGGGSAASGYSGSNAGSSRPGADDDDAEVDMSLYLSIQAHVRPPELHRSLFQNDKFFWFPKGSVLPTDSLHYSIPEDLLAQTSIQDGQANTPATAKTPKTAGTSRPGTEVAKTAGTAGMQTGGGAAGEAPPPMRMAVTESLLEALLNDVLGDDDVVQAFSQLDKPPAPCYVQLVQEPPAPFVHKPAEPQLEDAPATRDEEAAPMDEEAKKLQPEFAGGGTGSAQVATIESPRAATRGGTARPADLVVQQIEGSGSAKPSWMVLAGCDVPGHSAHVPSEKTPEEKQEELLLGRRRQVLRLPEFENLAHFVLDACIFNLLEEATFGEDSVVDDSLELCKFGNHWVEQGHLTLDPEKRVTICSECERKRNDP